VSEHTYSVSNEQPGDFPARFKTYVVRSVHAALTRVKEQPPLLPDEVRERALHVLTYAFKLPEAWPGTRELLLALLPKMELIGHSGEWMDCLTQGARYSRACGDNEAAAEFSWQLGYLYRQQSQFEQARKRLLASAEGFTQINQARGQARALNELAFVACLQHQYTEAKQIVETSLQLLDRTDPERAMSYRVLGVIAIEHNCWQEAEDYHRKSLHLSDKEGNQRRIAWCLQNLGYALRGQARFAEAIDCFERALAILNSIRDTYHWAIVQMNIGLLYYYQNQAGEALRCYLQSIEVFRKARDNLYLAKAHNNLGLAYWSLNKWPHAEQAFLNSIHLYASLGDESWRLNAADGLAMTYLAQKLYAQAIAVLEPAIAALPQVVDTPNYDYLQRSLTEHLREARAGLATTDKAQIAPTSIASTCETK
jgi:tetratricopeptide (TPR) repeat protein